MSIAGNPPNRDAAPAGTGPDQPAGADPRPSRAANDRTLADDQAAGRTAGDDQPAGRATFDDHEAERAAADDHASRRVAADDSVTGGTTVDDRAVDRDRDRTDDRLGDHDRNDRVADRNPSEERLVTTEETERFDTDRRSVVEREKESFGGMKFGSCFFGWLTATGTVVLLAALVSAAGAAVGLSQGIDPADATQNPGTVGLAGGIALLVVILIGYYCGGYVAGRMARFNGITQGVGVWLWAIIIAVVVAILGLVAGTQFDVLARLGGFPRLPINEGTLTTSGIIAAVAVVVVSLLGAILGGLAGMRYHRRVDKAGLGQ